MSSIITYFYNNTRTGTYSTDKHTVQYNEISVCPKYRWESFLENWWGFNSPSCIGTRCQNKGVFSHPFVNKMRDILSSLIGPKMREIQSLLHCSVSDPGPSVLIRMGHFFPESGSMIKNPETLSKSKFFSPISPPQHCPFLVRFLQNIFKEHLLDLISLFKT